jgi:hypothetical protein
MRMSAIAAALTVCLSLAAGLATARPAVAQPAAATSARAWGDNSAGELGNETLEAATTPVAVGGLSGAMAVSAGGRHVLALLSNGTVVAWGDNTFGQLGDGSETSGSSNVPVQVVDLTRAVALSAGYQHSLALLSSGAVMAWGDNGFNQLGNGTTTGSVTPTAVTGLTGVTAVAAGGVNSTALVAATPLAAPTPVSSIWRVVPTPVPNPAVVSDLSLAGVSAASTTDAWAVGTDEVTEQLPLAEHWNGTTWAKTTVPLPAGVPQAVFNGTDDLGPGNAWAVGDTETADGDGQRTLIEHWAGSAWAIVPSPNPETRHRRDRRADRHQRDGPG